MGYSSEDKSDEEEEEIFYGTALPPLEADTNAPKKADLDLTVRDEKGRRRFHGAFTGGFSAGYYNTVGSVEGWVPAQYVSNKDGKWDKNLLKSKPEDYMDDEDFSIFGIAPKRVQTKEQFKSSELAGFAGFRDPTASIVDVLKDVIKPKSDSIGVKLFKQMKRGKKYKGAQVAVGEKNTKKYGCDLPPSVINQEDSDEEAFVEYVVPFTPKNDFHGIGYKGLKSSSDEFSSTSKPLTAVLKGGRRLQIKGEAFGYGALENEDDYDEDANVYSVDDLSNYDFAIGPAVPTPSSKPKTIQAKQEIQELEGFVKTTSLPPKKPNIGDLPAIPRNWKPKPPISAQKLKRSRWDNTGFTAQQPSTSKEPVTMNANVRAILLGEEIIRVVATKNEPKKVDNEIKQTESGVEDKHMKEPPMRNARSSSFFASKFTTSSVCEKEEFAPGLNQELVKRSKEERMKAEEIKSQALLGKTNRETYQWHPHTLLCRRFNVPHPYPEYPDVVGLLKLGEPDTSKKISLSGTKNTNIFAHLFQTPMPPEEPKRDAKVIVKPKATSNTASSSLQMESVIDKDSDTEEKEERPPLDLFKAIFASSEEEESDDDDDKKSDENYNTKQKKTEGEAEEKRENISSRKSALSQPAPATEGIFANIDLDNLKNFTSVVNTVVLPEKSTKEASPVRKENDAEDFYGPVLPPMENDASCNSGSSDVVDLTNSKKRKKSEKRGKKHKKEKKKHKKHRR